MVNYEGMRVKVHGKGNLFKGLVEGVVVPNEDKSLMVIKLDSGYNVAVLKDNIKKVDVIDGTVHKVKMADLKIVKQNPKLKKVAIISLGGTIASRVDYKTGGVSSQFTSEDLLRAIPEISEIANITTIPLKSTFSENLSDDDWIALVNEIEKQIKTGVEGIVVTQGTDTMHYSSALLSFMLESINVPVVFVGAQRSSDRPSSDSAYNLLGALTFITNSKSKGVFVAMHSSSDDSRVAIHLGTKVRKMHSSRRDAFKSINNSPVAYVTLDVRGGKIEKKVLDEQLKIKGDKELVVSKKLSDDVALLKFYPSMSPKLLKNFAKNYSVVILEGTGLGHVSSEIIKAIRKSDCLFFMTTQTLYGRVNMNVYSTGRELQEAGVIGLEDMLPETALMKAKYILGKTNKQKTVKELMLKDLKGEITEKSLPNEFY